MNINKIPIYIFLIILLSSCYNNENSYSEKYREIKALSAYIQYNTENFNLDESKLKYKIAEYAKNNFSNKGREILDGTVEIWYYMDTEYTFVCVVYRYDISIGIAIKRTGERDLVEINSFNKDKKYLMKFGNL